MPSQEEPASPAAPSQELKRSHEEETADAGPSEKKQKVEGGDDANTATSSAKVVTGDSSNANASTSKTKGPRNATRRAGREHSARIKAEGRRRGTRPDKKEGEEAEDSGEPKGPRLPKRQCAVLIGYCGSGYSGMQRCVPSFTARDDHLSFTLWLLVRISARQPGVKTIEGVLFEALVRAGAVSQDNADNPSKVNRFLYPSTTAHLFLG